MQPFYTNFRVINCLLYDLAFSSASPSSVHTSIDLVFMELPSWKPEELQITVPTKNPLLLDACCPANNPEAFHYVNDCLE